MLPEEISINDQVWLSKDFVDFQFVSKILFDTVHMKKSDVIRDKQRNAIILQSLRLLKAWHFLLLILKVNMVNF